MMKVIWVAMQDDGDEQLVVGAGTLDRCKRKLTLLAKQAGHGEPVWLQTAPSEWVQQCGDLTLGSVVSTPILV